MIKFITFFHNSTKFDKRLRYNNYGDNMEILISIVLLLFPILIYLFYLATNNWFLKKENILFLDLALLSSALLVIRLNISYLYILANVPLLLAYLNKRHFAILFISFIITAINPICFIVYVLIYLLHFKINEKTIIYIALILIILFNVIFNFDNLLIVFVFCIISVFSVYLFEKGQSIIKMHLTLKEFEHDKQVRESLFKITHEIKNPIAVCKSYLDMYDSNNKDHQKYIPIVKEEIDKILYLLQDFLAMNKIKIEKDIMDINMLLETIVDHFEPILKVNNIKFIYEIKQDEIYMDADYNRLNQVFTNIIKNSIEAMNKEKNIIKIYTKIDHKHIKIYFEDNGEGMDKETLDHFKEPFYTTKKNGTGLGVSLSYEIIEAHKGTISYSSIYNQGTRVVISLPINLEFN